MRSSRLVCAALVAAVLGLSLFSQQQQVAASTTTVTISGSLNIMYGDPRPGSNQAPRTRYMLSNESGRWNLTISGDVLAAGGGAAALNRKQVDVTGDEVTAGKIIVDSISLSSGANASAAVSGAEALVSGAKNYATVLCKFSDVADEPEALPFFTNLMGMTRPGQNHYWREVSYENINLDGSMEFDWLDMPSPRATYFDADGNALLDLLADDCAGAHDATVDFSTFHGVNFVFNDDLDCCAWGGGTNLSDGGDIAATWMPPWAWTGRVFGHEIGHSIGMDHANDQYGNVYGNFWDVMGSGRQSHVNAYHKDFNSGWIPAAEIYTATGAANQQIRIVNLAIPPDDVGEVLTDYMMVKLPLGDDRYYTFEARKKVGYDGPSVELPTGGIPFEGVVIHLVDPDQSDDFSEEGASEIVDGTDNGNANDNGSAWVPGELFIDEANGVTVAVVSEYDDGFIISINPNTDVAVTKTATPNPAVAGELLTYNITVQNLGPGPATNVVVTDTLPVGTTFDEQTLGPGACTVVGQVVTCTIPGTIAANTSRSFGITVRVSPSIANIGTTGTTTITNLVSVVAAQDDDPTATNNSFSLTTLVVSRTDLWVQKECKPDSPAPTGSNAICTITVDNLGPSDAANVVLTDTHLSQGSFTILSAVASPGGACPVAGGTVTCALGIEPVGGRTTITVTLTSVSAVDVNDTACVVSTTPSVVPENNCASDGVSFFSEADLSLTKVGLPATVIAGQTVTHTITVTNSGPSIATDVVVRDNLPAEVTMVSATPSAGQCVPGTPGNPALPLTCALGNITSPGVATIIVVSRVRANTPHGTILFNGATVGGSSLDPNNQNNTQTATTNVIAQADLGITKTADAAQYKPNTTITYRVTVANNGASDAQNVQVLDTLPESKQAVYLSNTNPGGCVFQAPKSLTCGLGTMPAGTSREFFITMTVKGAKGDVINSATVSSTTADLVAGNNTASVVVTIKGGK